MRNVRLRRAAPLVLPLVLAWVLAIHPGVLFAQAQSAPAAPASAAAAEDELARSQAQAAKLTILQLLQKGGPVMYPLYLCSIVMLAFAIERGVGLRRSKILPDDTLRQIRAALDGEAPLDADKLAREIERRDSPLARVALAGLRKANRPLLEIEKAMEDVGAKLATSMRRNCRPLTMCASVSPLLGLLGTVTGIIRAFMTVAARAEAMGRTELLAGGIYEALVCTAVGLTIAIVSLVLYYFYVEKVEGLVTELDSISGDLAARMPVQA